VSEEGQVEEPIAIPMNRGFGGVGIVVVVLSAVCSAVGAAFGPTLVHGATTLIKPAQAAEGPAAEKVDEPPVETMTLDPLIVDVREGQGPLHHLKVTLAIELATKSKDEEELKKLMPRARDAAIEYTRALTFDEVTTPKLFEGIRTDLGERVAKAIGQSRVKRVLFTDFVVQ
jgi:flagellar basal body-associated protein FliL